jgi:hypothetical protein
MDRESGESRTRSSRPGSRGDGSRRRGVSEVTGLILLFGIVMAGVALIIITSTAVQDGINERNRLDSAEVTMKEVDSRLGTLSYDESANLTSVDFGNTEDKRVRLREETTDVTFTINELPACSATTRLGAIEYADEGGDSVVYEGGAVWRVADGEILLVQPPEMEYRNGTVTFVGQELRGEITETSTVFADKDFARSSQRTANFEDDLLTGPAGSPEACMLRNNLTITVEGPYYEGWAEFFDQEFPVGTITVDDANQRVELFLTEDDVGGFDSDGDGVIDEKDNCQETYNPRQEDTDRNDIGDGCDPDDDGDGEPDDDDNCQKRPNPGQRDFDGDEVGDVCDPDLDGDSVSNPDDNCFKDYNHRQTDLDNNSLGDVCDPDMDGDGIPDPSDYDDIRDWEDNCPRTPNPGQSDIDGGGRGDACDPDMDGDDVPNEEDNCPRTPNPDQADSDGNGTGDACENVGEQDYDGDGESNEDDNCPLTPNEDQQNTDKETYGGTDNPRGDACDSDDDGDNIADSLDNCQRTWNPSQLDTDNNTAGDACDGDDDGDSKLDDDDNCPKTYNPSQKDSDGDSIGDACENDESAVPDHNATFVDVLGTDANDYRTVTTYVTVDTGPGRNGSLTDEDFLVFEDYRPREIENVEPSGETGVDVVFVFDETASMNGTASSMKETVANFTSRINSAGISARYGLVTVEGDSEFDQPLTRDTGEFQASVDAIDPANGTDERPAGLDGIYRAADEADWRNESQRVIIYVSDDPSDNDRSVVETRNRLVDQGVTFYTISPPARRGAGKTKVRQIADDDGVDGDWLNIRSAGNLTPFFRAIESDVRTRYAVTFETCKAADATERDLIVLANDTARGLGRGNGSYKAPLDDIEDDCRTGRAGDPDPDPEDILPDPELPPAPGEDARNASDDDRSIKEPDDWSCDPDETPVGDNEMYDDARDVPDFDGDDVRGCYPSKIPDHGPGTPPEPYTNVVNVNVDFIRVSNSR